MLIRKGEEGYVRLAMFATRYYPDQIKSDMKTYLTSREQTILEMRYEEGKSLREVSNEFGVTLGRIRQVEHKALQKLYFAYTNRCRPTSEVREFRDHLLQKWSRDRFLSELEKEGTL